MRKFNFSKMDAAENAFFEKAFEHLESRIYEYKMSELMARNLVPKIPGIDPATIIYNWKSFDKVGFAKIITSYADDLPRSDVAGTDNFMVIKSLGASFGIDIMEIRFAKKAGTPLQQQKANAARRSIEEKIEELLSVGSAAHNMVGLLNQPNATLYTVPNGAAASPLWANKTGAEIVADMVGVQVNQVQLTKGQEKPNVIALDSSRLAEISTRFFDPEVSESTILDVFLRVSPHVKRVIEWEALATAGSGGTHRMLCFRQDADAVGAVIPQEFETFDPEQRGLEFITACHARCGGVVAFLPLAMSYADGI